jgi:Flp pilus assembly protein TadD
VIKSRNRYQYVLYLGTLLVLNACFGIASSISAQTDRGDINVRPLSGVRELPAREKRYALIIGIDRYQDKQIGALTGAANDARVLSDTLVRYAGFPADQVVLLSSDQPEERQPTRVNILQRLSNLAGLVPKDGLLFLSFSGHGIARAGQAFLLPSDARISEDPMFLEDTACSVTRIRDRIQAAEIKQVILLLDACRNSPMGRSDEANPLTDAFKNAFNFYLSNKGITAFAVLYATAVGERAYEYSEKRLGYFTWAVVEGIKGNAANEKGQVTLSALIRYVQEAVPRRVALDLGPARQQIPFASMEGYRPEELVIAVAQPKPIEAKSTAITLARESTSARLAVSPELYEEIGDTLLNKGRWKEAELAYRGAIQARPGQARLHNNLGVALDRQQRWADAALAYREAVRLEPNDAKYHDNLKIALFNDRKFDEAEKEAVESVRLEPANPAWRNGLGDLLQMLGECSKAESAYREALLLQPDNAPYHTNLGRALSCQMKEADAEVEFRRALRLAPNNQEYEDTLRASLQTEKKWTDAEAAYRRALQSEPDSYVWHYELGRALEKGKKRSEAEAEYREAARLEPAVSWVYAALGRVLEQQGRLAEAESELRQATRLEPTNAEFHNALSLVLRKQKKWPEAETEANEAVRLDPKNAPSYKENLKRIGQKKT